MPFTFNDLDVVQLYGLIKLGIINNMTNNINLRKGQLVRLKNEDDARVVVSGTAWVTVCGWNRDYVVRSGEHLPYSTQDLLIESLEDTLTIAKDILQADSEKECA